MQLEAGLSRRAMLGCACCATAAAAGPLVPAAWAAGEHEHTRLSPDEALEILKKGNADFVNDVPFEPIRNSGRRLELAQQQQPFAVVVGCSDSRVSPEILFGRSLGELFVVRVAGNTVDVAALGTIEYAVAQLGVPLVMVLGHERCGAVAAAVKVVGNHLELPGSIGDLVGPILPAVLKAQEEPGDLLDNAVKQNVLRVVRRLKAPGTLLAEPLAAGKLKIVGARYDLDHGDVEFLAEV